MLFVILPFHVLNTLYIISSQEYLVRNTAASYMFLCQFGILQKNLLSECQIDQECKERQLYGIEVNVVKFISIPRWFSEE